MDGVMREAGFNWQPFGETVTRQRGIERLPYGPMPPTKVVGEGRQVKHIT